MQTIGSTLVAEPRRNIFERRPEPPGATVTYDPQTDCYDYNAPGYHHQVSRLDAFKEGGTAGLVIGVPALVGAAETALMGAGASTLMSLVLSPTAGAVMGGVMAGCMAWKGTNKNAMYTGLAALVGVGIGTVAWPLLKLPGVWGGLTGALAATGIAAGGAAGRALWHNFQEDRIAKEHGLQRP